VTSAIACPLTVYYDGTSAACAREITSLKALHAGDRLTFVECTGLKAGIQARDANGRCFTGITAVEAAYKAAWSPSVQ
jgi:hypothetical protein